MGCPGETTTSMINGGICKPGGSSWRGESPSCRPRGRVIMVTLDIGATDPEHCGASTGLSQLAK